ncbi:hypothetical protein ACFVJS_25285, partial [Nocardioides sp. NPDC057772]|uniref:hypothetical protein n=1 Tax=Nocardioides sp. NPDC057772 TaxID=3346245 RepID=UPI003671A36C
MTSPETVRAVVLNVEDVPVDPDAGEQLDRGQGKVAGLVGLAKLAWRITAFARRPFAAPFALATPIIRGVVNTDSAPAVAVRHDGRMVSPREWAAAQQHTATNPRILVLVPPAGKDETVWIEGSQATGATYADRLAELLGWMPLHMHVTAGSSSVPAAVALSSRIQECVAALPGRP